MTLEFLVTSLVVVLLPGSGALYTVAAGLGGGRRTGIVAAFGCTLGIVPHAAAAITGLAAVLHASATAFEALRLAGVVWLLVLAWKTLRDTGTLSVEAAGRRSAAAVIRDAVLVNLFNPKLSIFFLAFLPQFVAADAAPVPQMIVSSLVFMALTFAVFAVWGILAATLRRHVIARTNRLAWLRRGVAAAFVGLGLRLALTER